MLQTNLRIYEIGCNTASEPLYNVNNSLFLPLLVGAIVCFFSWTVMSAGTMYMDYKLDQ
jgi:hypothetical protein